MTTQTTIITTPGSANLQEKTFRNCAGRTFTTQTPFLWSNQQCWSNGG